MGHDSAESVKLPCGQCIGCRLKYSRHWAIRCLHEASEHDENAYITLTYNQENLPPDGSLQKQHFQKFIRKLRKKLAPKKIRYYHAGEYGENFQRPHYHAIIFGWYPSDCTFLKYVNGVPLYNSQFLSDVWGHGYVSVGAVTFESAAYVARYIMKKINGDKQYSHYVTPDGVMLQPEYTTMSRRPGIGKKWFDKYGKTDVFPHDEVIIKRGNKRVAMQPPRYYTDLYGLEEPEETEEIKLQRQRNAETHQHDTTPARLAAREKVKQAQLNKLKRSYSNES